MSRLSLPRMPLEYYDRGVLFNGFIPIATNSFNDTGAVISVKEASWCSCMENVGCVWRRNGGNCCEETIDSPDCSTRRRCVCGRLERSTTTRMGIPGSLRNGKQFERIGSQWLGTGGGDQALDVKCFYLKRPK